MNCPTCGAENIPGGRFCQNCGQSLTPTSTPPARSAGNILTIVSARAGIALLLVWLVRTVMVRLPFMRSFTLPDLPFTSTDIVTVVALVVAIAVLLNYARALGATWPQAFPSQAPLAVALTDLVYLAVLIVGYLALEPVVRAFADDTALLLLQAVAVVIASILLIRGALVTYRHVPRWIATFQSESATSFSSEMACLHCGRLNQADMKYCGYCGQALPPVGGSTVA